jgi:hypothetical protein
MLSAVRDHPDPTVLESPATEELAHVAVQLVLPITVLLVGDAPGVERMLRQRRYRRPACYTRAGQAGQLEITWGEPSRHPPRPQVRQAPRGRPRRLRPVHPHAAADALALEHMDLAEKIAGNFARRTVHPKEDLLQLAMIGLIKAARRYDPSRGPFRPYGRTYANGEITHFLRDNGFLLKVPPTWREIHARGQRMRALGADIKEIIKCLEITMGQWIVIAEACSARVVRLREDAQI